ncbi:endo-1,4-beta-xylanase [Asticcacaulis excentricus]|uniref:Beta-xylanase n=1 Tax=Asticcacaulis excentricus TaxID=78587 RepID=A0A3G9G4A6_9CAUL|nr:endo-1,4-beta-xylanase [Asticcacaulis excentricus]BBF81496.1 endo-1,4-beta-xylanase A precursor [Asticcacaulis excentricus]
MTTKPQDFPRRTALAALGAGMGAALLSACGRGEAATGAIAPLKSHAPFPLGVCAMTAQMGDPQWAAMIATHFDRLTPEWEMKMEYILQPDGSLRFDAPDRIVQQARNYGQSVLGHTLIWYAQDGDSFQRLKGNRPAFEVAYRAYIRDVMTHYKGHVDGWDVVNEPILDDGSDLRDCLWREVLGDAYIDMAYQAAHEADPACPLILNDYNLEYYPAKRKRFLSLVEGMLKRGVPLHVLGTQTHIAADLPRGAIRETLRDLAATGLKIHLSELDISLKEAAKNALDFKDYRDAQRALYEEAAEAYAALPSAQQFGLTIWGLRDKDSWYNRKDRGLIADEPLLFDDAGQLKPVGQAFVKAL